MDSTDTPPPVRPAFGGVARIVMDHLLYAERNPGHLDEIARRFSCTKVEAIAIAVADHVNDEFELTPRADRR